MFPLLSLWLLRKLESDSIRPDEKAQTCCIYFYWWNFSFGGSAENEFLKRQSSWPDVPPPFTPFTFAAVARSRSIRWTLQIYLLSRPGLAGLVARSSAPGRLYCPVAPARIKAKHLPGPFLSGLNKPRPDDQMWPLAVRFLELHIPTDLWTKATSAQRRHQVHTLMLALWNCEY